ncbi:MAG TPA: ATP-binding cassette domain-containing protein [Archaeoglobaceae archaeon]|nr:ATP-binding cassette domain-containing protein [Archaeoglobaceae archaeon]
MDRDTPDLAKNNPIYVKDLTKKFNGLVAVDSISFKVKKGEIFGLLGPNGAGKTTTIKILVSLLRPDSGKAFVAGYDVSEKPHNVRKNIGIVFQEPTLDLELTARENLDFHARLYGMGRKKREERIEDVLRLVELKDRADEVVKNFSGGMQRRLEIARGLIHFPSVLFLDEPTLGLDVQTRRRIWDYIVEMGRKEGITIVLTTHYIEEADRLCDRVAIIDHGKIIAIDTPDNLKKFIGGDLISLRVADYSEEFFSVLSQVEGVKNVDIVNGGFELKIEKGEEKIPEIVALSQKNNVAISSISVRRPTLEDVFIQLTGRGMREDGEPKYWLVKRRK